jgi:hypothetical protein
MGSGTPLRASSPYARNARAEEAWRRFSEVIFIGAPPQSETKAREYTTLVALGK